MNPVSKSARSSIPTLAGGRLCIVLAAVLWSLSGLFTRLLQNPSALNLNAPALMPIQMAFFRALFAGLVMVPLVRRADVRFRPLMPWMIVAFAAMNAMFLPAIAKGSAANAILLQNIAPFIVFVVSVFFLGEKADAKSLIALCLGMAGMMIIVAGGDGLGTHFDPTMLAIGSGVTYAGVILCLRHLRDQSPQWLSMLNHLGSAVCLSVLILIVYWTEIQAGSLAVPTLRQLAFLAVFGSVQMGLPYWLFARGLRTVSPQEAGAITLLEPMLNPLWAYLISPETDTPPDSTWLGGTLILGALAYRYYPRKNAA